MLASTAYAVRQRFAVGAARRAPARPAVSSAALSCLGCSAGSGCLAPAAGGMAESQPFASATPQPHSWWYRGWRAGCEIDGEFGCSLASSAALLLLVWCWWPPAMGGVPPDMWCFARPRASAKSQETDFPGSFERSLSWRACARARPSRYTDKVPLPLCSDLDGQWGAHPRRAHCPSTLCAGCYICGWFW